MLGTLLSLPSSGCVKDEGTQSAGSAQGTPVLLCLQIVADTTQAGDRAGPGYSLLFSQP